MLAQGRRAWPILAYFLGSLSPRSPSPAVDCGPRVEALVDASAERDAAVKELAPARSRGAARRPSAAAPQTAGIVLTLQRALGSTSGGSGGTSRSPGRARAGAGCDGAAAGATFDLLSLLAFCPSGSRRKARVAEAVPAARADWSQREPGDCELAWHYDDDWWHEFLVTMTGGSPLIAIYTPDGGHYCIMADGSEPSAGPTVGVYLDPSYAAPQGLGGDMFRFARYPLRDWLRSLVRQGFDVLDDECTARGSRLARPTSVLTAGGPLERLADFVPSLDRVGVDPAESLVPRGDDGVVNPGRNSWGETGGEVGQRVLAGPFGDLRIGSKIELRSGGAVLGRQYALVICACRVAQHAGSHAVVGKPPSLAVARHLSGRTSASDAVPRELQQWATKNAKEESEILASRARALTDGGAAAGGGGDSEQDADAVGALAPGAGAGGGRGRGRGRNGRGLPPAA